MIPVIARIALRYAAGALVAAGYISAETGQQIVADPELLMLVGAALGFGVEMVYAVAKKLGWST